MSLGSISNVTSALDQQQLMQQSRAADGAGGIQAIDTTATLVSTAPSIYIPPPRPQPGPPPGRVPDIFVADSPPVADGTSSTSPDGALPQRLNAVRSFLLTLPAVTDATAPSPAQNIVQTGTVQGKTLLTI
jgi:hypothetical protein